MIPLGKVHGEIQQENKSLDLNLKKEYDQIDSYLEKKIDWFASAWDINSLNFLDNYNLQYQKLPLQ